jgi:hypothetical protein
MKQRFRIVSILSIIGIFLSFATFGAASENSHDTKNAKLNSLLLAAAIGTQTIEGSSDALNPRQPIKSPNRAFLSSLVVPGSGQYYIGAKRGILYTVADVGLLAAFFITRRSAQDTRDDYREKVRQHVIFDGPGNFETWDEIEDFEHATLYDNWHNVYTDNNGEPVERVGKWYWDDRSAFKDEERQGKDDSPNRAVALKLRTDANDKFETARTFLGIAILNHIVSAIDARIATKNYNTKHASQAIFPKPLEFDLQTTVRPDSVESRLVLRKWF